MQLTIDGRPIKALKGLRHHHPDGGEIDSRKTGAGEAERPRRKGRSNDARL